MPGGRGPGAPEALAGVPRRQLGTLFALSADTTAGRRRITTVNRARREPRHMRSKTVLVIALALLTTLPSTCTGSELDSLQGKWESRFQHQGKALRVLKIIDQNRETVETYDGDELVHRHVVHLEEKQAEGIIIMRYGESEVTHGPRKGRRDKPGSFVSKRLGDTWYNVQGLEANGDAPLTVMQFTRVNEPKRGSDERP